MFRNRPKNINISTPYHKLYYNKQKFNIYVLEKYNIDNLVLQKLKFNKLSSQGVTI